CFPDTGLAQAAVVAAPVSAPVSHPLVATDLVRSPAGWRRGMELFGEDFVGETLRLRGYEVHNWKLAGNRGIDLVATKRSFAGSLTDVRLIEVKTHNGIGIPRLGSTQSGTQMSRQWLANRLWALRSTGESGRKLALEIKRFYKAEGI